MPAASKADQTLVEGIKLALKAAKAYKHRNEGDRSESELVVAMLTDCLRHAEPLDALADAFEKRQRIAAAQDELRAAEAGVTPDSQVKP